MGPRRPKPIRIGIVGDYNPEFLAHTTTDASLRHAADALGIGIDFGWVPTTEIPIQEPGSVLDAWDGLWISAGSPYRSRDGVFAAIRYARERLRPAFAT